MEPVLKDSKNTVGLSSVADMHHFDVDPDPACHFYADPYSVCHNDADPDPTFYFDSDPNPSF